ncbi:hypothetical protein [Absidia glauca]|uniref:Uncharacterized protein n=1 Tax=Absidia glauca TaxID=4829 RepID=A0A168MQ08_ABSGL|nr:hypothetical protein [Absidia glauca]
MNTIPDEEKGQKLRIRLRPTRWTHFGLLLSLGGFILVLLCLAGGLQPVSQAIHFAKIQGENVTVTFGLLGYCLHGNAAGWTCHQDDAVKMIPFLVTVPTLLNDTHPSLFVDPVTLPEGVYPLAVAQPNHDPRIFAGCIICLICGGLAVALGAGKILWYVQDTSYLRGFMAMMAAVVALLLIAETTIMYHGGVELLNLTYPHLLATEGPGITMMGTSLLLFGLSSAAYLQGCLSYEGGYGMV